jgi:hypothetical protein
VLSCAALGVAAVLGAAAQTPQARPQSLTTSKFVSHEIVAGCTKAGNFASTPEYTVTCSYRIGPGVVEIHPKETDVIYVLDGAATFVTAGAYLTGAIRRSSSKKLRMNVT